MSGIIDLPLVVRGNSTSYSEYLKQNTDRGVYREVAAVFVNPYAEGPFPYPTPNLQYNPGVFWSHNYRYRFLRFRDANITPCNSFPGLSTVYKGNKTITSYIKG
jgi:hypothetical protein